MDGSAIVSGGITSVIVSGGAWKLAQSYIAKAVDQRLQKELERYKSQLALELERERQLAAQDLERFKSELALPAELRRQLAGKKLEALLSLVAEGEPFMRRAMTSPPRAKLATELLTRIIEKFQAASIYMDKSVNDQLWKYMNDVQTAKVQLDSATDPNTQFNKFEAATKMGEAMERAMRAYNAFMDLVRLELGIIAPAPPLLVRSGYPRGTDQE